MFLNHWSKSYHIHSPMVSRSTLASTKQSSRYSWLTQICQPLQHEPKALPASHLICPCCSSQSWTSHPVIPYLHPHGTLAKAACMLHYTVSTLSFS
ncbi:hypothetical protein M3J09_005350 [Ascochyta lentis]